jgi:hypothetical protein
MSESMKGAKSKGGEWWFSTRFPIILPIIPNHYGLIIPKKKDSTRSAAYPITFGILTRNTTNNAHIIPNVIKVCLFSAPWISHPRWSACGHSPFVKLIDALGTLPDERIYYHTYGQSTLSYVGEPGAAVSGHRVLARVKLVHPEQQLFQGG